MELKDQRGKYSKPGEINEENTPGCYVKSRHILACMGLLTVFNTISLRNSLTVAIVAMVNHTEIVESPNKSSQCPDQYSAFSNRNSTTSIQRGQFNWTSSQQGLLLGCYFYGNTLTCVLGGYLAKRWGFRVVVGTSMAISSVITVLSPIIAKTSYELFVTTRILLGFMQGVLIPSIYTGWGNWAPPLERSTLSTLTLSGGSLAMIVVIPASGLIGDHLGWEYIFYITGGFAMLFSVVFVVLVRNSPEEDPRISDQEKTYIVSSIKSKFEKNPEVKLRTPWGSMMTSLPVWAIIIANFANRWGNTTLNALLPTYMSSILKFNLSASGALSSLPNLLKFILMMISGPLTDAIRRKEVVSVTFLRKMNTCLGLFIPALFVVLAGYIGCDVVAATVFFTISKGATAFVASGSHVNVLDIAPKYGGILFGIFSTMSGIAGFLAPQSAGMILNGDNSLHQWQIVFWLSAGIFILGGLAHLVFGTAQEQAWAAGKVVGHKSCSQLT